MLSVGSTEGRVTPPQGRPGLLLTAGAAFNVWTHTYPVSHGRDRDRGPEQWTSRTPAPHSQEAGPLRGFAPPGGCRAFRRIYINGPGQTTRIYEYIIYPHTRAWSRAAVLMHIITHCKCTISNAHSQQNASAHSMHALQTSRIKIYAIIRERRKRQKRGIVPCRAGCAASRGATGGSCGRALERAFASCQGAPGRQEWQSAVCGRIGAFRVEGAGEVQWAARAVQMGSADACWRARVARAAWARANTFCGSGARALVGVLSEEFGLNMQNFQVFFASLALCGLPFPTP